MSKALEIKSSRALARLAGLLFPQFSAHNHFFFSNLGSWSSKSEVVYEMCVQEAVGTSVLFKVFFKALIESSDDGSLLLL